MMHILEFFRLFFPAPVPATAEQAPKPPRKPRAKKKLATAPVKKAPARKKK